MKIDIRKMLDKKNNGFTLIELSIVILIIGILILPILELYNSYLLRKELIVTRENVQMAVDGIVAIVEDRYPCPSDRSLTSSDPNFGIEQCDLTTIPACTVAGLQGICRATSAFDRDSSGAPDEIIIGGVPNFYYKDYTAMVPDVTSITEVVVGSTVLDGWENKLTYAVTANVTRPNRAASVIQRDFKAGVISALDENGNPTAGINDNALFAVISHGKDGRGAFNSNGIGFDNCLATARGENCNEDTIFMQGIALSEGTDPFDDISKFFLIPEGELWRPIGQLDASKRPLPHIRNMNNDVIGINIANPSTWIPSAKLEVNGTIRADSVRASNVCDENGINCFSPTLFGSGMPINAGTASATPGVCASGQVVISIKGENIQCGRPTFTALDSAGLPITTGTKTCPTGKYITSVLTNSCIICNDGSKVC